MPQLFTLPQQIPLRTGAVLPGAKLHFSQTGTSTPQNTYQDIDLTTAHANPVIADANGVFPPIYLDASLPDYRVRLTDASDVQLFQIDDVPSGQDSGRDYRLVSESPELIFEETDASANNKKWKIQASSERFSISLLNDAESVETEVLAITRSGTDLVSFEVGGSGTFQGTFTGFSGTAPVVTCQYVRLGNLVHLLIPDRIGTSNATTFTMTGIPSAIRPGNDQSNALELLDSGTEFIGTAIIRTDGSVRFEKDGSATGFTNSGQKGTGAYVVLTYFLDVD